MKPHKVIVRQFYPGRWVPLVTCAAQFLQHLDVGTDGKIVYFEIEVVYKRCPHNDELHIDPVRPSDL